MVRRWIIWIQLDRSAIFVLRSLPVPLSHCLDRGKRSVGLGQSVIEPERQRCCPLGQSVAFRWCEKAVITSQRVAISQSGIGQRVVWILNNRFLKEFSCLLKAFVSALVPMIASFQIGFIRFAAIRVGFSEMSLIGAGQFQTKSLGNVAGDVLLHCLDVRRFPLISCAPN